MGDKQEMKEIQATDAQVQILNGLKTISENQNEIARFLAKGSKEMDIIVLGEFSRLEDTQSRDNASQEKKHGK